MPHARVHAVSAVATDVGWSIASLWLLRRPGTRDEQELALKIAALYPILSYAPFFIAVVVPGSEVEDEPGEILRVAGMPVNPARGGRHVRPIGARISPGPCRGSHIAVNLR